MKRYILLRGYRFVHALSGYGTDELNPDAVFVRWIAVRDLLLHFAVVFSGRVKVA